MVESFKGCSLQKGYYLKKILNFLLSTIAIVSSLNAEPISVSGFDLAVESQILSGINKHIEREKAISEAVNKHIVLETDGLILPTTNLQWQSALQSHLSLATAVETTEYFSGYHGTAINVSYDSTLLRIGIDNIVNFSAMSDLLQTLYVKSSRHHDLATVDSTNGKVYIPLDNVSKNYITIATKASAYPNTTVSVTEPYVCDAGSQGHTWYEPAGDATFDVKVCYNGKWTFQKNTGNNLVGFKSDGVNANNSECPIFVDLTTLEIMNPTPTNGQCAKLPDEDGETYSNYTYEESLNKWLKESGGTSGAVLLVNEDVSLNNLLDRSDPKVFSSPSGSTVTIIGNVLGIPTATIGVQRKLEYWRSDVSHNIASYNGVANADLYIADDITKLPIAKDGSVAWFSSSVAPLYVGNENYPEAYYIGTQWYMAVSSLDELVNKADSTIDSRYYVKETGKIFRSMGKDNTFNAYPYWEQDDSLLDRIRITRGDRSDLPVASSSSMKYLTYMLGSSTDNSGDVDLSYTVNGVDSSYISTNSYGKLKQWFYSTTGTITNDMLDRVASGSQTFDSSGTFITPLGWFSVRVYMVGGGGGGAMTDDRGAGGGYAGQSKVLDISVTSNSSISVIVGGGGGRTCSRYSRGTNGGSSSFGSIVSSGGVAGYLNSCCTGAPATNFAGNGAYRLSSYNSISYRDGLKSFGWGGQASIFGNGGNGGSSSYAGSGGIGAGGGATSRSVALATVVEVKSL